ncbi:hypothetical protein U27_00423 [Candidatus Vecturithrix granuli]|uniref:AsmA domain-containing protein n=1 Tax=Vecturithrix granuli TaxID=1499967 RepID=A0A081C7H1_VECG1|nr:hypothetical protein U27_00423 [Candidatus Vecturithrix granuli]
MKKFVIVLGGLFCLVLLAIAALELVLDLNAYKGQIESPLEASLSRNVAIGNITHTLWRGPGASLQEVTVFDHDPSNVFVQIKEVIAKVKVLPLLSKKIELSKILLQQPVVTLKRNLEGQWNIDDLLGVKVEAAPVLPPETPDAQTTEATPPATPATQVSPQEPPATGQAPTSLPLSQFAIDTLRLSDGKIRVIDEMVNMTTELENLEITVDGVAMDSPMQFRLSANVDGGSLGKIEASGKVGPIPATGDLDNLDLDITAKLDQVDVSHFRPYYVAQLTDTTPTGSEKLNATIQLAGNMSKQVTSTGNVSVGDVKVDVAGNVEQVQTMPKLDLTISSQELPWEKLLQLLPPDLTRQIKNLGLSGLGNLTIQPKGTLDNLVIHGEFDLSKSGIQYQNVFAKPEATKMLLSFEIALNALKTDAIKVSALTLTVGELVLKAAGTVTNFKQPELDLHLESNEFPVDQLFALFPQITELTDIDTPLTTKGTGILQASARGPLDDLALQLSVNLDHSAVSYADFFQKSEQEPGNLHIEAQLGKDSVSIAQALLNVGKFQLSASGTIANFKQPNLDLVLETNTFDITSLLAHSPITTTKYLPKELTLAGMSTLRIVSVGSLDNLSISGKIDLTKSAVDFGKYFAKPKDLPGIIDFDATLTKDAVDIRKVQINLNDVILDITGMVSGLQQQTMLDLSVTSNRFALNQILPVKGMVMNPTGNTQLNFTVQSPVDRLNLASIVAANLELTDVGFLPPQFAKPVEHLTARLVLQGQQLTIQQLSATIGESSLTGNARAIQIFTQPDVTFALDASTLNIDELLGVISQAFAPVSPSPFRFVASTQISQTKQITATATSPQKAWQLANITATGTVAIAQGQAQNVHFSDLAAEVKVQNQIIHVEPLALHLYDGEYQGFVSADLSEPDPKYVLHSELVHVDSNKILTDGVSLEDIVYGFIFANTSLQGQGIKTEQILSTLSGSGLLKIEDGTFTTFNIWPQLAQIFQLLGSLGKSNELTRIGKDLSQFPEETHFSRFEGRFELKDGKAGSSDLLLHIPEQNIHLSLILNGEFGLDTSLDFIGKIRFDPQSKYYQDMEKYFRDFRQADGSIELPFPVPIGGTLVKPEINMKSVEKSLSKFAAEIARQAAQKQLEKVGTDLLKDLLKKKK